MTSSAKYHSADTSTDHQTIHKNPYQSYVYAYPHKQAYRGFSVAKPLSELWENENKAQLFLYAHIPFCEMRCGFCNLFTTVNPKQDWVDAYLDAFRREAETVNREIGPVNLSTLAIGGGTPTFLSVAQLGGLLDHLCNQYQFEFSALPASIETSPQTATADHIKLLTGSFPFQRISIGVQSFDEQEARAMGRPQKTSDVVLALDRLRNAPVEVLNIDLIYGALGQTARSFVASIERALIWQPEEIYLYPLYVRPLTGLGKRFASDQSDLSWNEQRLNLYRAGRDFLLSNGYQQISMRKFSKAGSAVQSRSD